MRNGRTLAFCCCLAALPLVGCAGPTSLSDQGPPAAAQPVAATGASLYGPKRPVAMLVFLPGSDSLLADDIPLWAAQGFDILTPRAVLTADASPAIDRLLAEARALTAAPIWLVGEDRALSEALDSAARLSDGTVSGVVATSPGSGALVCRESVYYADRGKGTVPKVVVRRSGNACPPDSGAGAAGFLRNPGVGPARPSAPSRAPRLIEALATPGQIKEAPSS